MLRHQRMTCAAAGMALAVTALAACTGSDPAPTETSAVVPSTTTSTTTTPTAPSTTTSAGPAFPAGLPDAAKTKDKAGAEAFVTYVLKTLNKSWTEADPDLLKPLCELPGSKACRAYVQTATDLRSKTQKYDRDPVSVLSIVALAGTGDSRRVEFKGFQERSNVVDKSGKVVLTDPREPSHWMFFIDWGPAGWKVSEVKLVAS